MMDNQITYTSYAELGDFYPITIRFDVDACQKWLKRDELQWFPYNESKKGYRREGLSLYSLDGTVDSQIDLTSIQEFNKKNQTSYTEQSFNTPTPYWWDVPDLAESFKDIQNDICRTHFIRLGQGGFFPPHRDLGNTFRLIALFNGTSDLYLMSEDKKLSFDVGRLYFLNTKKMHSIFSFIQYSHLLVLNVNLNRHTFEWMMHRLMHK